MTRIKIRAKKPWIGYPGSTLQNNFGEDLEHGYFLWDVSKNDLNVRFEQLPNPKPFITIDWLDNIENTISNATIIPGSRIRVRVKRHISQSESQQLSNILRDKFKVCEIVFKTDEIIQKSSLQTGQTIIQRDDLRNAEILLKLLKEYHTEASVNVSKEEWIAVNDLLKNYLHDPSINDDVLRNAKWSLRRLEFDNTFGYGEKNVIDFQSLSGIVGIFGANRAGKSSIVGTIMYALFNGTDRGIMKNIHVINSRKQHCYTNAIVNVSGVDYIIERQTTKNENKRGQVNASTSLNVFRVNSVKHIEDLAGEQRSDTEKTIKNIIGTSDDFLMTSLSAQDDINQFIKHGSSKRAQYMTKFIDLDVFARIHDLSNKDANSFKSQLKLYSGLDDSIIESRKLELNNVEHQIIDISDRSELLRDELSILQQQVALNRDSIIVTQAQVDSQKKRILELDNNINLTKKAIFEHNDKNEKFKSKLETIAQLKNEHDLIELRNRLSAIQSIEANISSLKHQYEKEQSLVNQQKKSLKILDDVPCGDLFPTCKFIKDAHHNKGLVVEQQQKVDDLFSHFNKTAENLKLLKSEKLEDKIKKIEQIHELENDIKLKISNSGVDLIKFEKNLEKFTNEFNDAKISLIELERAFHKNENSEIAVLRTRIAKLMELIKQNDSEKVRLASYRGKMMSDIEKFENELQKRNDISNKLKLHELITTAFTKKALPTAIINSQLPIINSEIAKILQGIVDFSIELEIDNETDSLEVFINYGDSKRIIELGSGMEKMIASLAIRVALINVSTLPKTDMFIIDEGFGALDESGVEACNRLLVSLKRYFRLVLVITHVDGIKDAVDQILEISKIEKDANIHYVAS